MSVHGTIEATQAEAFLLEEENANLLQGFLEYAQQLQDGTLPEDSYDAILPLQYLREQMEMQGFEGLIHDVTGPASEILFHVSDGGSDIRLGILQDYDEGAISLEIPPPAQEGQSTGFTPGLGR